MSYITNTIVPEPQVNISAVCYVFIDHLLYYLWSTVTYLLTTSCIQNMWIMVKHQCKYSYFLPPQSYWILKINTRSLITDLSFSKRWSPSCSQHATYSRKNTLGEAALSPDKWAHQLFLCKPIVKNLWIIMVVFNTRNIFYSIIFMSNNIVRANCFTRQRKFSL